MPIIKNRRDTAAQWSSVNPILAEGEIGFETDSGKLKIGDGVSSWSDLKYFVPEELLTKIGLTEISNPTAPAANKAWVYLRDNGSGKTQLVVRFPTGAIQVISTEP